MKMHPRAMLRHTRHVEHIRTTFVADHMRTDEPCSVIFIFEDNKDARLTMTPNEARRFAKSLNDLADIADRG